MLRRVGMMNRIWAEHKAIPWGKEGMTWKVKGWSGGAEKFKQFRKTGGNFRVFEVLLFFKFW